MEQQKERPMLFSGAMVRAILDGRKTQTRRVMKTQPGPIPDGYSPRIYWPARDRHMALMHMDRATAQWERPGEYDGRHVLGSACGFTFPYGQPGDRLWVRETFFAFGLWETRFSAKKGRDEWHFIDLTLEMDRIYQYAGPTPSNERHRSSITPAWWKRPAIHMPRRASRIALEITGVRIERLNDCSDTDALAEGIRPTNDGAFHVEDDTYRAPDAVESYARLWEAINGAGSWAANPWVWVVEFKRL